jgi:heme-degrading monooxygenase HmoA
MKRRICLKTILAAGASAAGALAAGVPLHPVQLHVDLAVDRAKEKEMLHNFETIFRPEAAKHPGYIDVKMLKLRTAIQGSAPSGVNYRFSLTYQSEELRQKWVASPEHRRVWPTIENTLSSKNYTVLLFDVD